MVLLRAWKLFTCAVRVFCFKEQLEIGSIRLKQTEENSNVKEKEFESVIAVKEDEIRLLKKQLKEISKAQNCAQVLRYEKEVGWFIEILANPLLIVDSKN